MSESERACACAPAGASVLRAVAAQRCLHLRKRKHKCTQLGQPHDRVALLLAKLIFIACGLALGGAALWLKANVNWILIGQR